MTVRPGLRKGMSLIELMVVVAIVGVLAAMSVASFRSVDQLGRLNGAATTLAMVLTNTRARAITERCTYVVQLSGFNYAPTPAAVGVGGSMARNTITVFRKRDCNSEAARFETALAPLWPDRRVDDYNLSDFGAMFQFPVGIVPGGNLENRAVSIAYTPDGARRVSVSDTAGNFGGNVPDTTLAPNVPLNITIRPQGMPASQAARAVIVPGAGAAEAP